MMTLRPRERPDYRSLPLQSGRPVTVPRRIVNAQPHRRVSHLGRWLPDAATLGDYRTFFTTAVRNPTLLGAATPTSRAVGEAVAQVVPTTGAPVVVELGPGTGSLSGPIHDRLPEGARHIGIELADSLVE